MKRLLKTVLIVGILVTTLCMPCIASDAKDVVYPKEKMSTDRGKYYHTWGKHKIYNDDDDLLCGYKFVPIWRINKSNSIYSVDNGSKFIEGEWWSQWELIDYDSSWYGSCKDKNKNIKERYYAEGVALGWGFKLSGDVSITAGSDALSAGVKVSASAKFGSTDTCKYQGVVSTRSSWTSCYYQSITY